MEFVGWLVMSHGAAVLVGLYLGRWVFKAALRRIARELAKEYER